MSGLPCPDCFSGTVHLGNPRGIETTIHGLPTYVASPPEGVTPKGIIVHITDAFGWQFMNNKLLCDHYAERGGYLVYMPDFQNGHAMPISLLSLMDTKIKAPLPWLQTIFYKPLYVLQALAIVLPFAFYARRSVSKALIYKFFTALRTSPPPFPGADLKIAAAGFCWGGLYTILLAHDEPGTRVHPHSAPDTTRALVDAAYTAHPSLVKVPADIDGVNTTVPLSISIGDDDMYMNSANILRMKDILEKKDGGHEVVIMPGAKHGFACRMDPADKVQMDFAERAEVQALGWFGKWLA